MPDGVVFDQVIPYIDEMICGNQLGALKGRDIVTYQVRVNPDDLQPSCGRDGAIVQLRLAGAASGSPFEVVIGSASWQPGQIIELEVFDLRSTFATPVSDPPVSDQ